MTCLQGILVLTNRIFQILYIDKSKYLPFLVEEREVLPLVSLIYKCMLISSTD